MVDYRTIANPSRLKAAMLSEEDLQAVTAPVLAAIGTNLAASIGPTQLDLRYPENRTVVTAVGGPLTQSWSFSGYVSPQDALTHYQANFAPEAEEEKPVPSTPETV